MFVIVRLDRSFTEIPSFLLLALFGMNVQESCQSSGGVSLNRGFSCSDRQVALLIM